MHRVKRRLQWRFLGLLAATIFLVGCAGSTVAPRVPTFAMLVAEQRRFVENAASSKDWTALAERFLALAERDPTARDDALFAAGIAFLFADDESATRRAVQTLETLLSESPGPRRRSETLYWAARAYERLGEPERARLRYQSLVNDHPDSRYAGIAWEVLTKNAPLGEVSGPAKPPAPTPPKDGADLGRVLGFSIETIVVDPGHGGKDPGAVQKGRPAEKEIALDVSERLAARLRELGYRVFLTRTADVYLPLRERNRLAHEWNADLFLSLHVNFADSAEAHGVEAWIAAPARDAAAARIAARENRGAVSFHDVTESLAALLTDVKMEESRRLADQVDRALVKTTGAASRGTKEAPFVVLLGLRVPSVLIELGFLTHRGEGAQLSDPAYRERLAEGIAQGVKQYAATLTSLP